MEKLCCVWASNLKFRELESHIQPSRPRTLNNRQTLLANKQLHLLTNCQSYAAKRASNKIDKILPEKFWNLAN